MTLAFDAAPRALLAADPALAAEVGRTVEDVVRYLDAHADPARGDRLWPADYNVYLTNPLSLAWGACGTALFLRQATGEVPAAALAWILDRPLGAGLYAPGLWVGLSGVAVALLELGHPERAAHALDLAAGSPLLLAEANLYQGAAGWGLACLAAYRATGADRHLDRALAAGEHLLAASEVSERGRCWRAPGEGHAYLGYGYGASGVALFLLRLATAAEDARFRDAALEAMEWEVAHAVDDGEALRWGSATHDPGTSPYLLRGTAGVGRALARCHEATGEARWGELARRAAAGARTLITVAPAQFDGLAGIGELLLDLERATGDAEYGRQAAECARSLLLYRVESPEGIAFPGRFFMRLTTDYGTGAAGVASFLRRLLHPGERSVFEVLYGD